MACECCVEPSVLVYGIHAAVSWASGFYEYDPETEEYEPPVDPAGSIPAFADLDDSIYVEDDISYGQYGTVSGVAVNWDTGVYPDIVWSGDPFIAKSEYRYAFRFQPPVFCRLYFYWEEVTFEIDEEASSSSDDPAPVEGDPLDVVPREWSWEPPSVNGFCFPTGYDRDDETTWPQSEIFLIPVPSGNKRMTFIRNVRYSFVPNYRPPPDGPDGFPPGPNLLTGDVPARTVDDGDAGDVGDEGQRGPAGADLGDQGLAAGALVGGSMATGSLVTGGLTTGSLKTSGLKTGGLTTGGLTFGALSTGSLTTGGLSTGGLASVSLSTGALTTGALAHRTLASGGLQSSHLTSGRLHSGGLASGGLASGGL